MAITYKLPFNVCTLVTLKIRARCLGKAQAEVQLNSLNCRDPELTWVEPTDALADAASGEGDVGAPLDA